jgi:hypothetical protein
MPLDPQNGLPSVVVGADDRRELGGADTAWAKRDTAEPKACPPAAERQPRRSEPRSCQARLVSVVSPVSSRSRRMTRARLPAQGRVLRRPGQTSRQQAYLQELPCCPAGRGQRSRSSVPLQQPHRLQPVRSQRTPSPRSLGPAGRRPSPSRTARCRSARLEDRERERSYSRRGPVSQTRRPRDRPPGAARASPSDSAETPQIFASPPLVPLAAEHKSYA